MLRLCRSLRMSQWQILIRVRFQTSFPFIFSGMKVAVTLAIIGIVVGEFIASQQGLGYLILFASSRQQTDLALLSVCVDAYHTLTGGTVAQATVQTVMDAMRDASAVIALYTDGKCETAARCLWPSSVSVTKDKHLITRAYCPLRKEWRTFRLGRMVSVHALTTPDALSALRLTFIITVLTCIINTVLGILVAWVLVRHNFPV